MSAAPRGFSVPLLGREGPKGAVPAVRWVPSFSYSAVTSATRGFASSSLIGAASTGEVFRGVLNNIPVAVKRLALLAGTSAEELLAVEQLFRGHVTSLASYRHPRIAQLLGYSIDQSPHNARPFALVLELMDGGTLADRLCSDSGTTTNATEAPLTAAQRIDIALGACAGMGFLDSLHRESGREAIDAYCVTSAKIGLTKLPDGSLFSKLLVSGSLSAENTAAAAGAGSASTIAAPSTSSSAESDVYSFGVVLLEMLMGRLMQAGEVQRLWENAEEDGHAACIEAVSDPAWPPEAVPLLASLIGACISRHAGMRPADIAEVKTRLLEVRSLVVKPLASSAPLVVCPVCLTDVSEEAGIRCAGSTDIASVDDCHFVCYGCLQLHVRSNLSMEALRSSEGAIPCCERGCKSAPWALEDLAPHLDAGTLAAYALALRRYAFDAERAKREAAASVEARERAANDAAADIADRVWQLRLLVVEQDLTMHCPRCATAFVDFTGCNCLQCESCGAGFCACCLLDCGSIADAHAHYRVAHADEFSAAGGRTNYYDVHFFERCRKERCLRLLAARLQGLRGEPLVQRALIEELSKHDLAPLGISAYDLERCCLADGSAPAAMEAPKAEAVGTVARLASVLHATSGATVDQLVAAFAELCVVSSAPDTPVGDRVRQSLIDSGAVKAMIQRMTDPRMPGSAIADACFTLNNLAAGATEAGNARRLALVAAGAAEALTDVLRNRSSYEGALLKAAFAAIAQLTYHGYDGPGAAAARKALIDAGIATPLFERMGGIESYEGDDGLKEEALLYGLSAIAGLAARGERNRLLLFDAGSTSAVKTALECFPASPAVFAAASEAVASLLLDVPETYASEKQSYIDQGVPEALVRSAALPGMTPYIRVALIAVARIVDGTDVGAVGRRLACIRAGIVTPIILALRSYPGSPTVLVDVFRALVALTDLPVDIPDSLQARQSLVDAGIAEPLLMAMRLKPLPEALYVDAFLAITNIASGNDEAAYARRRAFNDSGAAYAAHRALRSHPDSLADFSAVSKTVALLLSDLDDDNGAAAIRDQYVECEAAEMLIRGLTNGAFELSEGNCADACMALDGILAGTDDGATARREAMLRAGVLQALARAFAWYPTSTPVANALRLATRSLAAMPLDPTNVLACAPLVEAGFFLPDA